MQQVKFTLHQSQIKFVKEHGVYGFKDRSSLVRAALDHLREEIKHQRLLESAELYAEVYAEDDELRELTDQAISGWPNDEH
ncbi:MAG: hypothetical protein WA996_16115 [Candidatus Promineifilaceae bacterium]